MTVDDLNALLVRVACLWLSVLILTVAAIYRPETAQCPPRWHNDGVRRSGAFTCVRMPVGDLDFDGTWGRPERSIVPPGLLHGAIYCTGGALPIVIDDRTVGCQRTAQRR